MYASGKKGTSFKSRWLVYRTTAQSIPYNSWTKLEFNGVGYDEASEYDSTTNYNITIKKAGWYQIGASCGMTSLADGEGPSISIKLNSATLAGDTQKIGGTGNNSVSRMYETYLDVGDVLHVEIFRNLGGAKDTQTLGNCSFFGHRFA